MTEEEINARAPRKRPGKVSKRPPLDVLVYQYSQMTANEVGAIYGVTGQTVRQWMRMYRKELKEMEATNTNEAGEP